MVSLKRQLSDKDVEIEKQLEQLNLKDVEIKLLKNEILQLKENKVETKK